MGPLQRLAAVLVVLAVLSIACVDGCDKGACQVRRAGRSGCVAECDRCRLMLARLCPSQAGGRACERASTPVRTLRPESCVLAL